MEEVQLSAHEIQQLIATSVTAIIALSTLIPLGAALVRRVNAPRQPKSPALTAGDADRMVRMEAAIDAISLEVERVAESQRFMTRLIAERPDGGTPKYLPGEQERSER